MVLFALSSTPVACVAAAEMYPAKPVRIIVPFPAGGATDILGRAVAQKLGESLSRTIVVENIGGASTRSSSRTRRRIPVRTTGRGGGAHLTGAMICAGLGIEMQDVPYKGSAPALIDLMGGSLYVNIAFAPH